MRRHLKLHKSSQINIYLNDSDLSALVFLAQHSLYVIHKPEYDIISGAALCCGTSFWLWARRNLSLPSEEATFHCFFSASAPPNFPDLLTQCSSTVWALRSHLLHLWQTSTEEGGKWTLNPINGEGGKRRRKKNHCSPKQYFWNNLSQIPKLLYETWQNNCFVLGPHWQTAACS